MKDKSSPALFHVIAFLTVAVWGLTFISTKVLIGHGLSPEIIFVLRFLIAYAGVVLVSHRRLFARSWRDEGWLILGGVTGGSFYFWSENTALELTQATNVAFIVCTAPLYTALLSIALHKHERLTRPLVLGSLLAIFGMALVVYNGHFVLNLSPLGDLLSLSAALVWAGYSLIMRRMTDRYDTLFLSRKIFFYGILTILPLFLFKPWQVSPATLAQPAVWGNLLFLGVVASLICYAVWNVVMKQLGTVRASNYIYLNPLFTLIGSALFLSEVITPLALLGSACLLGGVYIAGKR
jgi:drug/metabolite transporter (DMT)-like permease